MIRCPVCTSENADDKKFCGECGVNLSENLTGRLSSDSLLENRYRIIRTIGRGGMGAVYLALDQRLNNMRVAIKEMSTNAVGQGNLQAAISSFKKEAAILIDLRHPALPRVIDFFPRGVDRWYLVMDFIEGKNLSVVINERGHIEEPEVLDWTHQICEILDFLHGQDPSIIFRDLKPSNIMLTPQGQIKLVDFGIARHFRPGVGSDTAAYGSTGFAPPEQYGDRQTNVRSDIYALGATLHFLLTGVDPKSSPFIFEEPAHYVAVSPRVNAAIMKSLEFRAENRPGDIAQFWELITGEIWPEHIVQRRRVLGAVVRPPGVVNHPVQVLAELREEAGSPADMEQMGHGIPVLENHEENQGQFGTLSFEEDNAEPHAVDQATKVEERHVPNFLDSQKVNAVEEQATDIELLEPEAVKHDTGGAISVQGENILAAETTKSEDKEDERTGTLPLSIMDNSIIKLGEETKINVQEESSTSTLALQLDGLQMDPALKNLSIKEQVGVKADQESGVRKPTKTIQASKEKEKPKAIPTVQQKKKNKWTAVALVAVLIISIAVAAVISSNKKQSVTQSPAQVNTTNQTTDPGASSVTGSANSQPVNSTTENQPTSTNTTTEPAAQDTGSSSAPSSGSSTKSKIRSTPAPSTSSPSQPETYDNRPSGETYDYRI
ncbi:MAG TPA: protein kinase [Syntrophomonadaceae bacterium]|nr:protein kinase [Syntrophomonadaceae bacterium]